MAIYEIKTDSLAKIEEISFPKAGLKERADLQRLLRTQIEIISPDTLIIAEEFGEWKESKRRIDLLGLDKDANLVVIELKTTESGGHMELHAMRYAAMVSTMTLEKAVEVYGTFLHKIGSDSDPEKSILEFLGWEEVDEEAFAQDVRIILVSADFSKELTTSVMWLNERDMDISCIRLQPYRYNDRVIVDIQQVIPLPEAEEYIIKIREKTQKERHERADRESRQYLRREFWQELLKIAKEKLPLFANISASDDSWIAAGSGKSGIHYSFDIRKHGASVNLVLEGEKEKNKEAFDILLNDKNNINNVFGEPLEWKRCDDLKKSYITIVLTIGGYRDDREICHEIQKNMIDKMIRMEKAFSPYIQKLNVT